MSNDIAPASSAPAGTGEGIASISGQAGDSAPAGSVSTQSTSEQSGRSSAEPTQGQPSAPARDPELGWASVEDAKRDYKALQSAYTKAAQAVAQFGDPRTVAEERAILAQLSEHPGFIQWVQQEIAREQAGNSDPDTIKALEIVDSRARQIANEMVAPLYATHVEQKVRTVFSEMDKEYGVEWQQLKPKMNEILQTWKAQGLVSPAVEQNFNYAFVKGLYAAAAVADPEFAAKAYQKRLAQKQANTTTSQPGTASAATAGGSINSFRDAFMAAKAQLGIS